MEMLRDLRLDPSTMRAFALAFLLPFLHSVIAVPNPNQPTVVKVRIEGEHKTLFDDFVLTRGHDVDPPSGGKHHCDGTNFGANPTPGPTCTSALDDASKQGHFNWVGSYFAKFDDYFVEEIAGQNQTDSQFWGLYLNYKLTDVGGCQQQVKLLDEVLWAFDAFNKKHVLKLTGPSVASAGKPVKLLVKDGGDGTSIAGAIVEGEITDANGEVSVVFSKKGIYKVKAEKDDSIRSEALIVAVA